jgi:hypothetical protein
MVITSRNIGTYSDVVYICNYVWYVHGNCSTVQSSVADPDPVPF